MRVAIECAGFTPSEADQLRRAMATFKHTGGVSKFADKLVGGMIAKGYTQEFAEQTFKQLNGFGSYGFPESHAASFALIAYASSWLKCHHPDIFCASLINAQPMGFYAVAQIVRDAQVHGVEVRPICINASRWDCTLEPTAREGRFAVRLGFRQVSGLSADHAAMIVAARAERLFNSVDDVRLRSAVPVSAIQKIAEADGFQPSLRLQRRQALWAIKGLRDDALPLFAAATAREEVVVREVNEPVVELRPMTAGGEVVEDYRHAGLTLRAHPVSFLRADLAKRRIVTCAKAMAAKDDTWLETAGLVLVRQRPGSAKGVLFVTIEDETGAANLILWPTVFEKFRRAILNAGMVAVKGPVQREGEVVHLIVQRVWDLSRELASVGERDDILPVPHGRGDQATHGGSGQDPRELPPRGTRYRDISGADLRTDVIKPKTRDFR